MKTWGIILAILGGIDLVGALLAFSNNVNGSRFFLGGIAFIVLGAYLIHRAGQKEKEKEDNWSNQ